MVDANKMTDHDSHWQEVMKLAEKYGFMLQAYGGTAILATHKNQLETLGEEKYLFRQSEMFKINMERSYDNG